MRPIQLQVRNFLSYGENVPPLRFDGLHVVCLSGPNGHGKSALLDAITWALWGKSRARSDDDLIHHGRQEMLVEFEFLLEDQRYRVRRERILRGRRGRSALEFFVWDETRNTWRSLSEPSIRATQRRIEDVLRLDYETFINSAYLKQGRADEFTTKTPGERKRILAEILHLDRYALLEQRAREHMRNAEQRVEVLRHQRATIEQEIAQEEKVRQELKEAEAALAELIQKREAAEAREKELQARLDSLRQLERDVRRQQERVRALREEIRALEEERVGLQTRLQDALTRLARREEIEAQYQELLRLREENAQWNERLARKTRIQERLERSRRALQEARLEIERQRAQLKQQIEHLMERTSLREKAAQRLAEAREQLERLRTLEEEQNSLRDNITALREEQASLHETLRRLKQDMLDLKERIDRLEDARSEPNCPLCGQPLSDEHVAEMLASLQAEGREMGDAFRRGQARLKEIQEELNSMEARLKQYAQELAASAQWQRIHAQAERDLKDAEDAAERLQEVRARLTQVERLLQDGQFAPDAAQEVAQLEQELKALSYDESRHEWVRERLERLAGIEDEHNALTLAAQETESLKERLSRVEIQLENRQSTLAREEEYLREMQERLAQLPEVEKQWRAQAAEVDRISQQEGRAHARVGAARQQLAAIKEQKKRLTELDKQIEEQREAVTIYRDLVQAFGKNGLQAMIIEAVLPEIEQEANRLLARMTEGRMTVRLNTQRELRSGEAAETLDIEIADEMGVRPYEMYSGGEAFRINFALRIALSKLLARRAGASLRSLFIDEGFGSQDSEGRLRLVDAINSIQDEFDLIVVITHIEELKEAFPVRIEVFKGPHGSTFSIT